MHASSTLVKGGRIDVIEIEKSPSADTRSAEGEIDKDTLLKSTKQHIGDVERGCNFFADMLMESGRKHDHTKIDLIDKFHHDFVQSQKEGKDFKNSQWYLKHLQERHHLHGRCPDDVNLIDVLEMISDIVMAGMSRSGQIYDDELSNEILQLAFKNTVELLKREVKVVDNNDIFSTRIDK
jgi:hypothetical protein